MIKKLSPSERAYRQSLPPPKVAGHCDMCGLPAVKFVWDHNHDLEALGFTPLECHRGWVHDKCNLGMGCLGDNPQSPAIQNVFAYLAGRLP